MRISKQSFVQGSNTGLHAVVGAFLTVIISKLLTLDYGDAQVVMFPILTYASTVITAWANQPEVSK